MEQPEGQRHAHRLTQVGVIHINDLDDSITSNVLKFVDDTKLFRKVNTDGDKQHLQNDLDRLVKWSKKWQMFNFEKCKCLHIGHGNLDVNYKWEILFWVLL